MRKITLMLVAVIAFCWQSNAQGDTFATATPITPSAEGTGCSTFNFSYDATMFTDSGMDGTCNNTDTGFDVFYTWTATTDGLIWNDGAGNPGIVIRDAGDMSEITCEGTFGPADTELSGWSIGQDLVIQVYDYGTAQVNPTTFCLEVFSLPTCPDPTAAATSGITLNSAMLEWTQVGSSMNWDIEWGVDGFTPTGTPNVDDTSDNPYELTGLTESTDYDFYVRSDCGMDNTTDVSNWVGPISFTTLSPPPSNDTCAGVIDLGMETSPLTASTAGATNDFGQDCLTNPGAPDVVYSIVIPNGSTLNIGQSANDYDSKHRLAYGGTCPGDTLIACTDDPDTNTETWTNTTGMDQTVYWVQSAYATGSGDYTLVWEVIACSPPVATTTLVEDCANNQFTIDVDVTSLGNATSVTISNDAGVAATTGITTTGVQNVGPFPAGSAVVLTVEHDQDNLCNIDLAAVADNCPPANDDFVNATPIDCSSGTINGSTAAATLDEDNAPDGGGADLDAPNVWYSIDSSVDGASDVTLNLCGSSYDTSVLVYTGTSGNLTFVAANDDNIAACGQCCQSLVTFPTDGTSTYYVTVEGYNATSIGNFEMVVSCVPVTPAPANDDCADAVALTTGVTASGTTVGATTSAGDAPTCDTFGSIADVWYSFEITGGNSNLSITTTITGTSDQANVALYDDCAALAANSLGCSDGNGGETLDVDNLDNGTYYIRVWSDGNAPPPSSGRVEGTFDIVVNATLSTNSFENEAAFTYYPNPVKNTLTLNAQNTIEAITMYNMLGQEVLKAAPNTVDSDIDMSGLANGAYFVKVTIANITKTIRVIKQ